MIGLEVSEVGEKVYVFIDGQNFYLSARAAFGLKFPDFDIEKLGNHLAEHVSGENASRIKFYTGMPVHKYSPRWFEFWQNKLGFAEGLGIDVVSRPLRYHLETDPTSAQGYKIISAREKGIDLCLALDVMEISRRHDCSHIVIVSRDQDFQEVIKKINIMCDFEQRDITIWSAYPVGKSTPDHIRGIDGTKEIRITFDDYQGMIDTRDYRGSFAPGTAEPVLA